MALPSSGSISFNQVNTELGRTATQNLSMSDSEVRSLFQDTTGAISMSSGHGKSSAPPYPYNITYLTVAGGAGSSSYVGSGGGAGGMLEGTVATGNSSSVYSIQVGAGGNWNSGGNHSIGVVTTNGGGFGVQDNGIQSNIQTGQAGGSGGGSFYTGGVGGAGIAGQGFKGGDGYNNSLYRTGGGGGAGQAGQNGGPSPANGGNGRISSITGTSIYYAGGGGGGTWSPGTTVAQGGLGGGGHGGGWGSSVPSAAGQTNTGSGAGGGGGGAGNNGGSGVVIFKVPTANYSSTHTAATVTTSGAYTILKFTSSGSYTS